MTQPGLEGAAFLTSPPRTEAEHTGRGVASAGRQVVLALVAAERTQAGICSHPSHLHPQRLSAARASPGSKVHSNRGAVREMQLRFLSTLLRMVPTPPPPPPWRFRHRPPRRREPVSLSCRIRERRRPPGSSLLLRNDSVTQGSESPSPRGSRASGECAAGPRRRQDQRDSLREQQSSGRPVDICSAEPKRLRPERAGWEGRRAGASARARRDGGGASVPNPGISLSWQGGLSPRARASSGGQKQETRQRCRTPPKPRRDGGAAGADTSKSPPSLNSRGGWEGRWREGGQGCPGTSRPRGGVASRW